MNEQLNKRNRTCSPFLILGLGEAGDCQGETLTMEYTIV